MSDQTPDLAALEALAEAILNGWLPMDVPEGTQSWWQTAALVRRGWMSDNDAAFVAAADPATMLWLIREVGRLRVLERCPHGQTATELCNAYPSLQDVHETQARAEKAEAEVERLRRIGSEWTSNYESWVSATRAAEQERDALIERVRALVADWQANGNSRDLGDRAAGVWHQVSQQLLTVLDGGESNE